MLKTIDLFAGAGGLSLGFQQTGAFEIVAAAEINENARKTYQQNICPNKPNFIFINNVEGYDFEELNRIVGGIDVVIGGPPCQGFSNANRQKNHLISMNNGLVKEYFRAIKQIRPKAFVMENVSMLRSDTHRFYESEKDNDVIDDLIAQGFNIPKRNDTLFITQREYAGVDWSQPENLDIDALLLPETLFQLLNVLCKNLGNYKRLPGYIQKNGTSIKSSIEKYVESVRESALIAVKEIIVRLNIIKKGLEYCPVDIEKDNLEYIISLQKALNTIKEIRNNRLIGKYSYSDDCKLCFNVNSYSVIDYVNAILGNDYIQKGDTICSEWFGVPQERRRYIILGIRKDCINGEDVKLPAAPQSYEVRTVWDAIGDLQTYDAGYDADYPEIPYNNDNVGEYARDMREGSVSVKNHITTKTTPVALERFKAIPQGKNFHSLSADLKSTYSKPERTQNTIYLRLNETAPSGTVVNVRKSMWIHPRLHRAITVREAARLQSFPDKFEFMGTKDSQYQQVGNAVPPLLAKEIAYKVLENINK